MTSPLVPIVRPAFDESEAQAVAAVVRSGWIMQGPQVQRFEHELGAYLADGHRPAPHVVAVANGTAALELALRALGVGPGDEVITVSHSFIATANSILSVGATPVFVDVQEAALVMDPAEVEHALSPQTKAILCVHQLGHAADIAALLKVADDAGVPLIEDAACALGSEVLYEGRWEKLGRPHGAVACFSFHPRKVISTGEGGACVTTDGRLAARIRSLRQHAIPAALAHPDPNAPDGYAFPAFNARMTDIAAAIGLCQLAKLSSLLEERRAQADALHAQLADHPVLLPPLMSAFEKPNWQSYAARIRPGAPLAAKDILQRLQQSGISARGGLTNAHEEPAYTRNPTIFRSQPLPHSERWRRNVIMLPLFPGLTVAEKAQLASALRSLAT